MPAKIRKSTLRTSAVNPLFRYAVPVRAIEQAAVAQSAGARPFGSGSHPTLAHRREVHSTAASAVCASAALPRCCLIRSRLGQEGVTIFEYALIAGLISGVGADWPYVMAGREPDPAIDLRPAGLGGEGEAWQTEGTMRTARCAGCGSAGFPGIGAVSDTTTLPWRFWMHAREVDAALTSSSHLPSPDLLIRG
jgi:hypothetical protein